jgi:hypothetical protein
MRGLTLAQKVEEFAHNGERDVRSDRTEDNLGTQEFVAAQFLSRWIKRALRSFKRQVK